MANYKYKALDQEKSEVEGLISAASEDIAINSLQRRGLILTSIKSDEKVAFLDRNIFDHVPMRDIVNLSRQISTLFQAQVSALKVFSLIGTEVENVVLKNAVY